MSDLRDRIAAALNEASTSTGIPLQPRYSAGLADAVIAALGLREEFAYEWFDADFPDAGAFRSWATDRDQAVAKTEGRVFSRLIGTLKEEPNE